MPHTKTDLPQRILVTGASGAIGTPVCRHLLYLGHQVCGFSKEKHPDLQDHVVDDLCNKNAVKRAVNGIDIVIHLGAYPNNSDFLDVLMQPNVRSLYNVCSAAADAGVKKLVLASSLQVVSGHHREWMIRIQDGLKPTNHYALTEVWAEDMVDMYARVHDLSVINVRIGWFSRKTGEAQRLGRYEHGPRVHFSHDDACRFFERCIESLSGYGAAGPDSCTAFLSLSATGHVAVMSSLPA